MKKIEFQSITEVASLQNKISTSIYAGPSNIPKPPYHTDKVGDTLIGTVWQNDKHTDEKTGARI